MVAPVACVDLRQRPALTSRVSGDGRKERKDEGTKGRREEGECELANCCPVKENTSRDRGRQASKRKERRRALAGSGK